MGDDGISGFLNKLTGGWGFTRSRAVTLRRGEINRRNFAKFRDLFCSAM